MHIRIVTFRLDGIDEAEYLASARQVAPAFQQWTGLQSKTWIRDRSTGIYGGIYVFDSPEAAAASRATPVFEKMVDNPAFVDLEIRETEVIEELTRLTGAR